MKIIEQSHVLFNNDLFSKDEKIEYCGRVCYNSQNAIQPGSAEKFINGIIKRGHTSVLEHSEITMVFDSQEYVDNEYYSIFNVQPSEYSLYKYFIFEDVEGTNGKFYKIVSSNIRGWYNWAIEAKKFKLHSTNALYCLGAIFNTLKDQSTVFNFLESDKSYGFVRVLCSHGVYDIKSKTSEYDMDLINFYNHHCAIYTFEISTTRGTMAQLTRHRCLGFSCQSTRYCNYALDKFGKDIKFIIDTPSVKDIKVIEKVCKEAEKSYFSIIENGGKPEDARSVLPQCLATVMMVSGTYDSWLSVFALRCDSHAQKEIRDLCEGIQENIRSSLYSKEYSFIKSITGRQIVEKEIRDAAKKEGLEIISFILDTKDNNLNIVFNTFPSITFTIR